MRYKNLSDPKGLLDDKMINLNKLAKKITLQEGGKKSLSIAQTKEVMKLIFIELAKMDIIEVLKILKKYDC